MFNNENKNDYYQMFGRKKKQKCFSDSNKNNKWLLCVLLSTLNLSDRFLIESNWFFVLFLVLLFSFGFWFSVFCIFNHYLQDFHLVYAIQIISWLSIFLHQNWMSDIFVFSLKGLTFFSFVSNKKMKNK